MTLKKKSKQPRVGCDKCGLQITVGQLKAHTGTKNCRNTALKNRRTAMLGDYVEYSQYDEIGELVNLGAIPEGKIVGYQFTAYVPRWIDEAIHVYKKSRGYAELDLLEFINKVRPNSGT